MTSAKRMYRWLLTACLLVSTANAWADGFAPKTVHKNYRVRTVDFLERYDLTYNGAGPLLVKADDKRNRVVLVNTNTSSVSVVDSKTGAVKNIPLKNRVLQHLKMEALAIDSKTGKIYVVGNKCLHIVSPDDGTSTAIETEEQYEMVAVNEINGDAYLVGQASTRIAWVKAKSLEAMYIPWLETAEPMVNLNMTPPPPIRKVVCDSRRGKLIAVDGFTATLYTFSTQNGKQKSKRDIDVKGGARWHMAGYDKSGHLYLVIEQADRKATEAVKIPVGKGKDTVVQLPGLTEAVGISYNPVRREIYIPYDNHEVVHVVDFKGNKAPAVIKVPAMGNDASVIDLKRQILYVASWMYGEVEVIDIKRRELIEVIPGAGILPHMFNMAYSESSEKLYIPTGATAVNGSFGAALDVLDPKSRKMERIKTGWAPTSMVEKTRGEGFYVFNSENEMAEVNSQGKVTFREVPGRFINNAISAPSSRIYISYGPHQSYWPAVYIWAARNGILSLDERDMTFYDRRIPRMAQQMVFDDEGVFYALQNNWGGEPQFLKTLPDHVRNPNLDKAHIELGDKVTRETTQRVLAHDPDKNWLYIVRAGETDPEFGILQVYDIERKKVLLSYPTGRTPTDLAFDDKIIYVANFDSDTITTFRKENFAVGYISTGQKPFKLAKMGGVVYAIKQEGRGLETFTKDDRKAAYELPRGGRPSNLLPWRGKLIVTGHSETELFVLLFDAKKQTFETLLVAEYPFGETTVDTGNSAFYMRGQFADGLFEVNQIAVDKRGRVWVSDYLSGKLFIIEKK